MRSWKVLLSFLLAACGGKTALPGVYVTQEQPNDPTHTNPSDPTPTDPQRDPSDDPTRPPDDPSLSAQSCVERPVCGTDADSCCESLAVPGGTFHLDGNGGNTTTVSAFRLDKYEVTVARFRRFVDAGFGVQARPPGEGSGANPHVPGSGWNSKWSSRLPKNRAEISNGERCEGPVNVHTWTDGPSSNDDRPMNCVDWYEAFAFCVWDGGRLPTLAEWNFAAIGGDEQRTYPWSATTTEHDVDPSYASFECLGDGATGCTLGDLLPVGSKPKGNARWGHADMAGNVYEWTLDGYKFFMDATCVDCANLDEGPGRVARGGSFMDPARQISPRAPYYSVSLQRSPESGFRCARDD